MLQKKYARVMIAIIASAVITQAGGLIAVFATETVPVPVNAAIAQEANAEQATEARPQEVIDNDNGNGNQNQEVGRSLYYTVRRGGPVMIPILLLAVLSLTLIIERLIFFTRNRIWSNERIPQLMKEISEKSESRFREDREDELRSAFQLFINSMERGMAFLSGIGNLAPILGFLGTVTGMITAFAAIAAATTVNARVVAVGIQEALITTAGGLMVAAPTLFFYYLFTHVVQNRYTQAEEAIDVLTSGLPRLTEELSGGEAKEGVFNG